MTHWIVLRVVAKALVPYILLFGLYVQFHGDFGPGGGFQAGVIVAASFVLYALIFGVEETVAIVPIRVVELGLSAGVLLYGAVGLVAMARGGNFLDYSALMHDAHHGQHWGIFLVELGVGITVSFVMLGIFFAFARFRRVEPEP